MSPSVGSGARGSDGRLRALLINRGAATRQTRLTVGGAPPRPTRLTVLDDPARAPRELPAGDERVTLPPRALVLVEL